MSLKPSIHLGNLWSNSLSFENLSDLINTKISSNSLKPNNNLKKPNSYHKKPNNNFKHPKLQSFFVNFQTILKSNILLLKSNFIKSSKRCVFNNIIWTDLVTSNKRLMKSNPLYRCGFFISGIVLSLILKVMTGVDDLSRERSIH